MKINEYLAGNTYPGRFIAAGFSPKGELVYAYAIMGRSRNSRNRVFRWKDGGLYTEPFDASLVEDPSLIIYPAILKAGDKTIVANGDQSLDIKAAVEQGKGLGEGIVGRTFEPDEPNWTPRISLLIDGDNLSFAINRRNGEGQCERVVWSYPKEDGVLHVIHTYDKDGNPLPSFSGDPKRIEAEEDFADALWNSLDKDNRISLYVREGESERLFNAREEQA